MLKAFLANILESRGISGRTSRQKPGKPGEPLDKSPWKVTRGISGDISGQLSGAISGKILIFF